MNYRIEVAGRQLCYEVALGHAAGHATGSPLGMRRGTVEIAWTREEEFRRVEAVHHASDRTQVNGPSPFVWIEDEHRPANSR